MIHALGAGGPFASRAFLPAFVVAMLLRFGVGWVGGEGTQLELAAAVAAQSASWFTHDVTLWVLGVLSFLELAATKSQELRELLGQLDPLVKPVMAGLTTLGFVSTTDVEIVEASSTLAAGVGSGGFALLAAGGTFAATWVRRELLDFVEEIDADDTLGIAKAISWFEEFWVIGLVFLTVVLPFAFMAIVAVGMALMAWINRELERRAELNKVACEHCERPVFASAPHCPACGLARTQVCDVGPFGQPNLNSVVSDVENQPLRLLSKRRCSMCASALTERTPYQTCKSCERPAFANDAEIQRYVAWVGAREKQVLVVCLVLPLVPLLGVVASIAYYRVTLVSPYRRYVPARRALVARWSARFVTTALFAAQCLPGAMSVAALINHRVFRRAFLGYAAHAGSAQPSAESSATGPAVVRWSPSVIDTLRRQRRVLVATMLMAAVALPILAATLLRASGADALALPRCPTPAEQLVGTWRARPYLVETYEWGGAYTLQVLVPEMLGGLMPETELMTLEGTYAVYEGDVVITTIAGISRAYAFGVRHGTQLEMTGETAVTTTYERVGEPPPGVAMCPRTPPAGLGVPVVGDAAAPATEPNVPPHTRPPGPAVATTQPGTEPGTGAAGTPDPTSTTQPTVPAEPLGWLPLLRPWSRLHLHTSECDEGAYDHLQTHAVPTLTWTPPQGPSVVMRMDRVERASGSMLILLAQLGDDPPLELLRYGPVTHSGCQDDQSTVGYVGIREDGTLLVSMERLPQRRGASEPARAGHTLRAIVRWNAATGRADTVDSWEGRVVEVPAHLRVRSR
ncbi:MAG: DUF4126 family protein [Sandaracinaceae bacterium]|nr:DUF4126 family protein [Sandaracinaceae bacterium]